MNKEIKFRAWDSYRKKMIKWEELVNPNVLSIWNLLNGLIEHIKPMQFTGLKDKNGKEIYFDDFWKNKHDGIYLVRWSVGYACVEFQGVKSNHPELTANYFACGALCNEGEIIGNIHETPELL